jgi:hypothetical protein
MSNINVTIYKEVNEELISKLNYHQCTYFLDKLDLLKVLSKHSKQLIYFLEQDDEYALFITYPLWLNIFTFSKFNLKYKVKIIGIPCSISSQGYYASSIKMEEVMFDYIYKLKGAKLVLNSFTNHPHPLFATGTTLPTCIINNNYDSISSYLNKMRSQYRHRIKKAINNLKDITIKKLLPIEFNNDLYQLYLNVYNKSKFKLEKLPLSYFKELDAEIYCFYNNDKPVGFIQLTYYIDKLTFMFCGLDYKFNDVSDLYYLMLYKIIEIGIENKVKIIDLGQTTENTKLRFAASLEYRYFYVAASNKIIDYLVHKYVDVLGYQVPNYDFNVMKDGE